MRLRTSTIETRHLCRRCLQCGREQPWSGGAASCEGCGCDFHERPPRSYADLEGLVEFGPDPGARAFAEWRATVTTERWLLTAFGCAILAAFLLHAITSLLG